MSDKRKMIIRVAMHRTGWSYQQTHNLLRFLPREEFERKVEAAALEHTADIKEYMP